MLQFDRLDATAVALDMANVDTDQIIPARFLWRSRADGFGQLLFNDLRTLESGAPNPDFVLNRPEHAGVQLIVTEQNFGCGSSREHAVWALLDAGIRVVVAPSFGDIFFNNSLKNGLLPVILPESRCAQLRATLNRSPGAVLRVDLAAQTISGPTGINDGGGSDTFAIDPFRKQLLMSGMDDITFTLTQAESITEFEARYRADLAWL